MDIRKTIRLIAVGFIFTLVNINITFNQTQVNIMPDFIGWALITIACFNLGDYVKGKPFYSAGATLMTVFEFVIMIVSLLYPKYDLGIYKTAVSLLAMIYIFLLLTLLEKIGRDKGYNDTASIRILKYVYVIVFLIFQALTLAASYLPASVITILLSISGLAALVTAIATAYVLIKMSILIQ